MKNTDAPPDNTLLERKQAATKFLRLVVQGDIEEAYRRYVDPAGKHHNPFFPAGFPALKQAMIEDHARVPNKQIIFKNVLGDEDLVAVHSHLVPARGDPGMVVVHVFRFHAGRIVEMWDCGQKMQADSPNADGAF